LLQARVEGGAQFAVAELILGYGIERAIARARNPARVTIV